MTATDEGLTRHPKRFILSGSTSDGGRAVPDRRKRRDLPLTIRPKWCKLKDLIDGLSGWKTEKEVLGKG